MTNGDSWLNWIIWAKTAQLGYPECAARSDISVRIISHEITSVLSDCILFFFYDVTASKAFSSSQRLDIVFIMEHECVRHLFTFPNVQLVSFFIAQFGVYFSHSKISMLWEWNVIDRDRSRPSITAAQRSRDAMHGLFIVLRQGKAISVLGVVTLQSS